MAGQMIINGEVVTPVLLEGYPEPTGSIDITENGTYDVKDYAEANVNVQGGGDDPAELAFRLPDSVTEISEDDKYSYLLSNLSTKISEVSIDLNKLSNVSGEYAFMYCCLGIQHVKKAIIPTMTISGECGLYNLCSDNQRAAPYDIDNIYVGEVVCNSEWGLAQTFACRTVKSSPDINIKETNGVGSLLEMFGNCIFEQPTFTFKKLDKVGVGGLAVCFEGSSGLTDIYFSALNSNSFPDGEAGQFEEMLLACENITVHFPSNLESVIGNWSDVVGGFAGTNTTVLFDLDATE